MGAQFLLIETDSASKYVIRLGGSGLLFQNLINEFPSRDGFGGNFMMSMIVGVMSIVRASELMCFPRGTPGPAKIIGTCSVVLYAKIPWVRSLCAPRLSP